MDMTDRNRIPAYGGVVGRVRRNAGAAPAFAVYVVRRFVADQGLQTAASLTYTTLLGLVPLLAVFLAILGAFPAFETLRSQVQETMLAPFEPASSAAVRAHLETFLENTRRLGVVGAIGIGVTAILMLNTIEKTLNGVWRVADRRPIRLRLLIFWGLLTVPPILMAASLYLSSHFFAIASQVDVVGVGDHLKRLTPLLMQMLAFSILFFAAPNRRVRPRDALIGGFVAALLFEGLKTMFGFYVASAGSQEAIYGALAAIPFFLVWVYASWTMILIGAEVAAALPEWRGALAAENRRPLTSGERLTAAVALLALLWRETRAGRRVEREDVDDALPAESVDTAAVLQRLIDLGYVVVAEEGFLVVGRDLSEATVYDLQRDLGLALVETTDFRNALAASAPDLSAPALADMLRATEAAKADIMAATLKSLVVAGAQRGRPAVAADMRLAGE